MKLTFKALLLAVFCFLHVNPSLIPAAAATESTTQTENPGIKVKLERLFSNFLRRDLTIEKMRWLFLTRYVGTNVKLWENPGVLLADAPIVKARIGLKSITAGRVHIDKMEFINAIAYLRFTHSGAINVISMMKDLTDHARATRKYGQKQKAVYNIFRIKDAKLHVIDAETGVEPFGEPFLVNGKGDINGLGPKTKFPFYLEAVHMSTMTPMQFYLTGTMSSRPIVHLVGKRIPLQKLETFLPIAQWFKGELEGEFDFSKGGAYVFWAGRFWADEIKTILPLPFPSIQVEGYFHSARPSNIKVNFLGNLSKVETVVNILGFKSKKIDLSIQSMDADIGECIEWVRTGAVLAEEPNLKRPMTLSAQAPSLWRMSGKVDIDARLNYVMGPRLVQEADGQIQLKIRNGVLAEMPGFIKMFQMLNLSSLLIGKSGKTEGLEFGSVNGVVDIKNGVAQTRGIIFLESPTLDVAVEGKVDFSKQTINARMLMGIVSVPEDVLRAIPLIRRFGTGEKRGVLPIWLEIQGPIQNPGIHILSLKSFNPELWKTLPERLRVPEEERQKIYR